MSCSEYDVLIVGARCAGATLATFLARAGMSVLVLDKAPLPSDQVLSTHTIHPPGIAVLDEIGVGDAMREVTPPTGIMRLERDGAVVDLAFPEDRVEYCPRRQRLDGLLQQAATAAGAELLDRTRVTGLLRENGRVTGVTAVSGEQARSFRAGVVVGADGRNSTIAELVEAGEYLGYDAPRAMFWGYWDAPAFWNSDPAYPFGMYIGHVGGNVRVIFQTDHDQLLIGSLPTVDKAQAWRRDPLEALLADLASDPTTGPLIEGAAPAGKIRGTVQERYFFRESAGPGWALVGDAGHHKEFVIGDGMTEALLQAKTLAKALCEGTDQALARWWRARDVEALPLYFFGQDQGSAGPPSKLRRVVFTHVAKRPELKARMVRMLEHEVSPYDVFPVTKILGWTLGAALGGNWGVLREFRAMGERAAFVKHEWEGCKKRLADLE
jgi:menaquinone-9 beta-reductase